MTRRSIFSGLAAAATALVAGKVKADVPNEIPTGLTHEDIDTLRLLTIPNVFLFLPNRSSDDSWLTLNVFGELSEDPLERIAQRRGRIVPAASVARLRRLGCLTPNPKGPRISRRFGFCVISERGLAEVAASDKIAAEKMAQFKRLLAEGKAA